MQGFVSLVTASTLANKGHNVIVPDTDVGKVDSIDKRKSPLIAFEMRSNTKQYLIFRKNLSESCTDEVSVRSLPAGFKLEIFIPNRLSITPLGLRLNFAFSIWYTLYLLLWMNQKKDYKFYTVYYGEQLVHYSVVLPKYYRFPFMEDTAIQIGPYWTKSYYRGRGLCPYVLSQIMSEYAKTKVYAYVIIRRDNVTSQRAAVKGGLIEWAYSFRTPGLLGKFYPGIN